MKSFVFLVLQFKSSSKMSSLHAQRQHHCSFNRAETSSPLQFLSEKIPIPDVIQVGFLRYFPQHKTSVKCCRSDSPRLSSSGVCSPPIYNTHIHTCAYTHTQTYLHVFERGQRGVPAVDLLLE